MYVCVYTKMHLSAGKFFAINVRNCIPMGNYKVNALRENEATLNQYIVH
jgi:hypothetical protein